MQNKQLGKCNEYMVVAYTRLLQKLVLRIYKVVVAIAQLLQKSGKLYLFPERIWLLVVRQTIGKQVVFSKAETIFLFKISISTVLL